EMERGGGIIRTRIIEHGDHAGQACEEILARQLVDYRFGPTRLGGASGELDEIAAARGYAKKRIIAPAQAAQRRREPQGFNAPIEDEAGSAAARKTALHGGDQ